MLGAADGTFEPSTGTALTEDGTINGGGGLVKTGAGMVILGAIIVILSEQRSLGGRAALDGTLQLLSVSGFQPR
jgi:hypothetical protein